MEIKRPLTAIYVDDNGADRALVEMFLQHAGVDVHAFASLDEATAFVEAASDNEAAVILLDLNLGPTHGAETVREALQRYGDTLPIIAVTGMPHMTEAYHRVLDAGADAWLGKRYWPNKAPEWIGAHIAATMRTVLTGRLLGGAHGATA